MEAHPDLRVIAEHIRAAVNGRADQPELFVAYARLAIERGESVTNQDVHTAWYLWAKLHDLHNPDAVPYDQLPKSVQAEDSPYARAIRSVARSLT